MIEDRFDVKLPSDLRVALRRNPSFGSEGLYSFLASFLVVCLPYFNDLNRPSIITHFPSVLQHASASGQLNLKAPWISKEQFGHVLKWLCYESVPAAVEALIELQLIAHELNFPKGTSAVEKFAYG